MNLEPMVPLDPVSPNPAQSAMGLCGCGCACYCARGATSSDSSYDKESNAQINNVAGTMFGKC